MTSRQKEWDGVELNNFCTSDVKNREGFNFNGQLLFMTILEFARSGKCLAVKAKLLDKLTKCNSVKTRTKWPLVETYRRR